MKEYQVSFVEISGDKGSQECYSLSRINPYWIIRLGSLRNVAEEIVNMSGLTANRIIPYKEGLEAKTEIGDVVSSEIQRPITLKEMRKLMGHVVDIAYEKRDKKLQRLKNSSK